MALTRPKIQDLDTTIEYFKDPITTLNSAATQANVDVGFMFNRANGIVSNVALYWSESAQAVRAVYTNSNGEAYPYSNIAPISNANLIAGNVFVDALFYSNGQPFVSSSYGNANVAAYLPQYTGNVSANVITVTNGIVWAGNGNTYSSGSGTGTGHGVTYTVASAPPVTGNTAGDQWYNTTTDTLYEYINDGTDLYWIDVQSPAFSATAAYGNATVASYLASGNITIGNIVTTSIHWPNGTPFISGATSSEFAGATPPAAPSVGTQWYNTVDDTLYEYITDGTNFVWVDIQTSALVSGNISTSFLYSYLPSYGGNITAGNVISTFIGNVVGNQTDSNIWTTGNIIPAANVTYNIGTPTNRFSSLYLSGNTIDLNGAVIKSDPTTGSFALVAAPTVTVPNPVAVIVTPSGGITTATTTGGVITGAQIATAATAAGVATSITNLNVTSTASLAQIIITNGIQWANGLPFTSGSTYSNANVAAYLAAGDPTIANVSAAIATANIGVVTYINSQVSAINTAWTSNATAQENEITGLRANIIAANAAIISANTYTTTINTAMVANIIAANAAITALQANTAGLYGSIQINNSNDVALASGLTAANAAIVTANTAMVNYVNAQASNVTTAWIANAVVQLGQINAVNANVTAANAVIASQGTSIATLQTQVYANANVATYLPSYLGSLGGTLTTASQTNITSVGQLTGLTSTGVVNITNTTRSTSTTTGALQVSGGAGIAGDLSIGGNVTVAGNIITTGNVTNVTITGNSGQYFGNASGFNALYAGIASGYTLEPQTTVQISSNFNGYAQTNSQNINNGGQATTDYVLTSGAGNNTTFYVDLGIAGSGYNNTNPNNSLGTSLYPMDAYLYAQGNIANTPGGNLVVGTTVPGTITRFIAGGVNSTDVIASIANAGVSVNSVTTSTNSTTGALTVAGGVGVAGNLYVGGYAAFGTGSSGLLHRPLVGGTSAALYNTNITPSQTNYTLASDGNATTLNSAGGMYFAYQNNIIASVNSTTLSVTATTPSTSTSTGALTVAGGASIAGNLNVGVYGTSVHQLFGNVVIGTSNGPASAVTALEVNQNAAAPFNSTSVVHVFAQANAVGKVTLDSVGSNQYSMYVARTAAGTATAPTSAQSGQVLGAYIARGYGSTGFLLSNAVISSGMVVTASQNYTDSAQGTRLYLNTTPLNATAAVTGLWIDSTGNVVIPTATAATSTTTGALLVAGGAGVAGNLYVGGNLVVTGNVTTVNYETVLYTETANVLTANSLSLTTALPVSSGGTGAQTVTQAQANLNVDPAGTAIAMAIALG